MAAWKPGAGITRLRAQVTKAKPKRDQRSDGIKASPAHTAANPHSDHEPNARGFVLALDVDEDVVKGNDKASESWMMTLANQLRGYAASGLPGADRIAYVIYEQRIASGTYKKHWWTWRGRGYGHTEHLHVSMTTKAEKDGTPFPLPIFGFPSFADQKAALAKAKAAVKKAPVKKAPVKKAAAKKAAAKKAAAKKAAAKKMTAKKAA